MIEFNDLEQFIALKRKNLLDSATIGKFALLLAINK